MRIPQDLRDLEEPIDGSSENFARRNKEATKKVGEELEEH
jgi:hypothetical protein